MIPRDALANLEAAGLALSVSGQQLMVGPQSAITEDHKRLIKQHRSALIALLTWSPWKHRPKEVVS